GLVHEPEAGLKLASNAEFGYKTSKCFDSGSDSTKFQSVRVYSNKPIMGALPENGAKTAFEAGNVDTKDIVFLTHMDSVPPKDVSGKKKTITKVGSPTLADNGQINK